MRQILSNFWQTLFFMALTTPQVCHNPPWEATHNTINIWHFQVPVNFFTTPNMLKDQVLIEDNFLLWSLCVVFNNIPTMKLCTGIPRISSIDWTWNYKIMHCGIYFNVINCSDLRLQKLPVYALSLGLCLFCLCQNNKTNMSCVKRLGQSNLESENLDLASCVFSLKQNAKLSIA